jgi:mono/diheme cytochrome c family protein
MRVILPACLASGLVVGPGCKSTPADPPPAPASAPAPVATQAATTTAPPAVHPGRASYLALCAPCHGPEGKGYAADHAPSLVNPTFLESASDEFLRLSIVHGRPGTSMAAYGRAMGGPLDEDAVTRIVAFLRSQGPAPRALPAPAPGNADRGKPLYLGLCRQCHGDATARGEAIHLANQRFLEQASDAFIRHAIVHGRPGTKMEAFGGKLTDQQIDDVVAHVRQLGTLAGPAVALLPAPTGKEPLVINP